MRNNKFATLLGRVRKAERRLARIQQMLAEYRSIRTPLSGQGDEYIRFWLVECRQARREIGKARDLLLAAFSISEQAINHSLDILIREPNGVIASNSVEAILLLARANVRVMLKEGDA